jgi:hypothetical protein
MMKAVLVAITLFALLSIGVAGPFTMLDGMTDHAACPIAVAAKLTCITLGTLIEHVAALQGLLIAIPSAAILLLAALAMFLIGDLYVPRLDGFALGGVAPPNIPRSRRALLRWQARMAHSPTAA